MKVMIVDDTVFMRMTIRRILESNGFEVIGEASDGAEATMKYKTLQPDLVIMDISMPRMDGIEAVKQIKLYDEGANIIMCSLQGQRASVMEAIKAGAKGYLVKPVKEDKLVREIQKLQFNAATRAMFRRPSADVKPAEDPTDNPADSEGLEDVFNTQADYTDAFLKGVEQGYMESKREIATNMIRAGIAIGIISACVELSEEEIDAFKSEYNL